MLGFPQLALAEASAGTMQLALAEASAGPMDEVANPHQIYLRMPLQYPFTGYKN